MTVTTLRNRSHAALLPLLAALALFPAHVAYPNPIAPTGWASDQMGNLYEVYVYGRADIGPTDWGWRRLCAFTLFEGGEIAELEWDPATGIGIVSGSLSDPLLDSWDQRFDPFSYAHPCNSLGQTPLSVQYTGLEYVNGLLYGTSVERQCGPSTFSQLDPVSGAVINIGPTGMGTIAGLAWDGTAHILYGVTGCGSLQVSQLVQIDMATGAAQVVGTTGVHLASLAFDYRWETLFAGGDTRDGGHLYMIDRNTGAASLIPGGGMPEITGLADPGGFIVPIRRPTWGHIKVLYR